MSFPTSESDLATLFQGFGQVPRVHIPTDRQTGRARGFAFVEMPNDEEAFKAVAGLDGKEFGGRSLKVNEARPRPEHTGPRNGSGGGRGPDGYSKEDYREATRQLREPRW